MNPYSVLGISKDSDLSSIKKAYRKLSLQFHPDRNQSIEAKTRILEINEAYGIIGDVESRRKYDHIENMKNVGDVTDLTDIFHMMYTLATTTLKKKASTNENENGNGNGDGNNKDKVKIPIIQKNILISMEQSYYGCTLPVEIQKQNKMTYVNETIYITIKPGIDNNEIILLKKQGNIVDNNHIGDIEVMVNVQNVTNFKRLGIDLLYRKSISLKEALCGFTFEIEHINGKKILINNIKKSTIIYPNYRTILPQLGMLCDPNIGNLIIEFEIEFPSLLSKEQIQSLENIL